MILFIYQEIKGLCKIMVSNKDENAVISMCIITKNEATNLERCLKNLTGYSVEMVVVDTGSTDDSKKVAERYTDKVYDFAWCDDFSKARNYAISVAHGAWIFMIDTDEFLERFDYKKTIELLQHHNGQVGRVCRLNYLNSSVNDEREKEWINRVFQKEQYMYSGSIHEQIVSITGHIADASKQVIDATRQIADATEQKFQTVEQKYQTFLLPITMLHTGYVGTKDEIEKKADRNIALLTKELKRLEGRGQSDPYILYQLGKGYYLKKDYKSALEYFEEATSFDLNPKLEYVLDLIIAYGYTLLALKMYEQALNFEGIYKEFSYSADFMFLMGLIYMNNALFEQAIQEFLNATKKKDCLVEGVNGDKAYHNIGVIYECLGKKEEALRYYKKCEKKL